MKTAERLRWALDHTGTSIRGFHKEMKRRGAKGHSYPTIHGYLAGKREPPLEFLLEAAKVLDVREEWLALGSGEPTVIEDLAAGTSSDEQIFIDLTQKHPQLSQLPEGTRQLFLDVLRRYALGATDTGRQITGQGEAEILSHLAGDLILLVGLPLDDRVWGLRRGEHSEAERRNYCVACLHAISLLLPDRGRGESITERKESLLPRLSKNLPRY